MNLAVWYSIYKTANTAVSIVLTSFGLHIFIRKNQIFFRNIFIEVLTVTPNKGTISPILERYKPQIGKSIFFCELVHKPLKKRSINI